MIYVKTVYGPGPGSYRLPDISSYNNDKEADGFIRACLQWGINIVSCEKISEVEAEELLANGEAETMEDE